MNITLIAIIVIYTLVVILTTALFVKNNISDKSESEWEAAKIAYETKINLQKTRINVLETTKAEAEKDYNWAISELEKENKSLREQLAEEQGSPDPTNPKERLPKGKTNTLRFMDYRTITDKTSQQYKLQEVCETNYDTGIRAYYIPETETDYYCVALGSAYGQDIGDTWEVTLQNGQRFNIILAECKDDGKVERFGDPDINHDGYFCTNVIEFVSDKDYMPSSVISAGTYTKLRRFGGLYGNGGNIVKMEYTGRVWKGAGNE